MPGKKIVEGLGEFEMIAQAAPHLFGSLFSFGVSEPRGHEGSAVHRYSPRELSELFRVGIARPDSPLFAILGAPEAHSRSPEYHNGRFVRDGIDALYVHLRADSFPGFLAITDELGLDGASCGGTATRGISGDRGNTCC